MASPDRGHDRPVPLVRRLTAAAALLLLCVAFAAWAASYRITPTSVTVTGTTATGVNTRNVIEMVRDGSGTYVQKNVGVSATTLGNLAKGALKRVAGPVGVALTIKQVVEGAGWAIDELGQQVVDQPRQEQNQMPAGSYAWCLESPLQCVSSAPDLVGLCNTRWPPCAFIGYEMNGAAARYSRKLGAYNDQMTVYRTTLSQWTPEWGTGREPVPITADQLGDLLRQHPEAAQAVLLDDYGRPIMTPELAAAINDLRKAAEALNGDPAGPDVTADPNLGETNSPDPETELPLFCDYAPKLCEWLDWTRTEEKFQEVELPEEELPIQSSGWSSGLPSSGSCPAPIQVTVPLGAQSAPIEFSYQPLCDFLALLRYVLIAGAMFIAAKIVVGLRATTNA